MRSFELKPIKIGLHIPKCAGTSVLNAINDFYGKNEYFQSTLLIKNHSESIKELSDQSKSDLEALRMVWGHHVTSYYLRLFEGRPIFLFTTLREPWERFKSMFFFDLDRSAKIGVPFDANNIASYIDQNANFCTYFFLDRFNLTDITSQGGEKDAFMESIKSFNVYSLDELDRLKYLDESFSNIKGYHENKSNNEIISLYLDQLERSKSYFQEKNQLDIELYHSIDMNSNNVFEINLEKIQNTCSLFYHKTFYGAKYIAELKDYGI